jgi:hypothetical protein
MQITTAQDPPIGGPIASGGLGGLGGAGYSNCAGYPIPAGEDPNFSYCCNPPSQYNNKWPVDPTYLWSDAYTAEGSDVLWSYADDTGNNNMDSGPSDPESYGGDPYGFVMLDGPADSLDSDFSSNYNIVRRSAEIPNVKRSLMTDNRTTIDKTFEHTEETVFVYCNHPHDSPRCRKVFLNGAEDTIIRLPDHVGEGPFARIISMEPAPEYDLPTHHIRSRQLGGNNNGIYKLTFDYDFHLIKQRDSGPVNIRVDYTNLVPYWQDITDTPAAKKRDMFGEKKTFKQWRGQVDKAKEDQKQLLKRAARKRRSMDRASGPIHKRWFGAFVDWLTRLTTVEKTDQGTLSMSLTKSLVLYSGRASCSYGNAQLTAAMDVVADARISMEARWAYYFSGTIATLHLTDAYAYFGVQPQVYLGLRITGNAELDWPSDRVKLIDTLSYPGLSIKGVAAVGPTLDLWGQLRGTVTLSGQLQVGSQYNFAPAEIYYGDKDEVDQKFGDITQQLTNQAGNQPQFSAGVTATAQFDVIVTPEAKLGLLIGGSIGPFSGTLMDAQLVAFVNSTLRFYLSFQAATSNGVNSASYSYGIFLLYNVGYSCYATLPFGGQWNTGLTYLFPAGPMQIDIYPLTTVPLLGGSSRRDIPLLSAVPRRGLLSGGIRPIKSRNSNEDKEDLQTRSIDPWQKNSTMSYSDLVLLRRQETEISALPEGGLQCTNEPAACPAPVNSGSKMKRAYPGGTSPTNCPRQLPFFQCEY